MRCWLTFVTDNPRRTLALVAAVTLLFTVSAFRLHVETDGYAFVATAHPVMRLDAIRRALFGLRDPLVVVLDAASPGGALRCRFIEDVERISEAIRAEPDVDP